MKRAGSLNQNMQQKMSVIKDENLELSQKVGRLEKENKFLKETEVELGEKLTEVKGQVEQWKEMYEGLEGNNADLIKMVEDL